MCCPSFAGCFLREPCKGVSAADCPVSFEDNVVGFNHYRECAVRIKRLVQSMGIEPRHLVHSIHNTVSCISGIRTSDKASDELHRVGGSVINPQLL